MNETAGAATGIDLSSTITVFVTTVGAPTFDACLAHLAAQDCRFTLRVIERVAPMRAAFQRMLDDCRTPFYVQVDEDMLLMPHAVRTLHERIEDGGPQVAMFAANLFDEHLQRCIIGVKIFRHAIARRYPFAHQDAFEIDQVRRFRADGYLAHKVPTGYEPVPGDTLGLHGTRWTPESIYERYATLERRRRTDKPTLFWFVEHAPRFLERFQNDPSEENFFALMGVVAGVLASRHGGATSKDFRTYEALPGFAALREFLSAIEALQPAAAADAPAARAAEPETRLEARRGNGHAAAPLARS
ncbi:MAG: hypothetical protein ABI629_11475 [bacterium]